jgi:hypothetical protein
LSHYLSICAVYRDEGSYLAEWIEFHCLVGVERFFLYDNASEDEHVQVLAPYIDDGTVVLHDGGPQPVRAGGQASRYERCLTEHGNESRWIAFLDLDEFLFSPTGSTLPETLADYESWPAVGVERAWFGTSGHRTKPPGLVIENYVRRRVERTPRTSIKSIVDPSRTVRCVNPHEFIYRDGLAVDENQQPIKGVFTTTDSFERLRVNHYYTKSESECAERLEAWNRTHPDYDAVRPSGERHERFNQIADDTLVSYAPAVREALGRRAGAVFRRLS